VKLTLRQEPGENWWCIEKAEHTNEERWIPTKIVGASWWRSARVSDSDVEGPAEEMLQIAAAIERHQGAVFKRCAVACFKDGNVVFWSPRNHGRMGLENPEPGIVSKEEALALAKEIREKLAMTRVGT
jgi:hypothetical protein